MCGRFSQTLPMQDLLSILEVKEAEESSSPRYNIAPTQDILILRMSGERRELASVRWGLVPSWSKEPPSGAPLINARCETLKTKPSFKAAFRGRRCLVPTTGFYEWKKEGRKRLPYHITFRDGRLMLLAGLWERWQNHLDPNIVIDSCAIITCDACPAVRPLHDRMPVIIPRDQYGNWLEGDLDQASALLIPYEGDDLLLSPANPVMNSGAVEGPECLRAPQGELF